MAGSLLMLVAILALYVYHHQQLGTWTSNLLELYKLDLPSSPRSGSSGPSWQRSR
jgi:hypothetical protein